MHLSLFSLFGFCPSLPGRTEKTTVHVCFTHYFLRRRYRLSGYGMKGLFSFKEAAGGRVPYGDLEDGIFGG
jgi:hypothetical protein